MSKIVDAHCPGEDPVRNRMPETFVCPKCGDDSIEIWTDEVSGKCSGCKEVYRKEDLKAA